LAEGAEGETESHWYIRVSGVCVTNMKVFLLETMRMVNASARGTGIDAKGTDSLSAKYYCKYLNISI
jgi:hypothetical protein